MTLVKESLAFLHNLKAYMKYNCLMKKYQHLTQNNLRKVIANFSASPRMRRA